jgi:hypothetical protein
LNQINVIVCISFEQSKSAIWTETLIQKFNKLISNFEPSGTLAATLVSMDEPFVSRQKFILGPQHIETLKLYMSSADLDSFLTEFMNRRPEIKLLSAADQGTVHQIKRDLLSTHSVFVVGLGLYYATGISRDRQQTFWDWFEKLNLQRDNDGRPNPLWTDCVNKQDGSIIQTVEVAELIAKIIQQLFEADEKVVDKF